MIYEKRDIGKAKAFVAKARLMDINPETRIQDISENLNNTNAEKLLAGFDVIVDCTDNMESRYVINKFSKKNGAAWIYGTVLRDEGFSSTFIPHEGPCFSCIYPKISDEIENNAEAGVISPIIGIIASWQVMETIKIITGIGKPNLSKILRVTLNDPKFGFINIKKKHNCKVCTS